MVGPWVTEQLGQGYLAVNWEATVDEVAQFLQPHPTLSKASARRPSLSPEGDCTLADVIMPQLGETVTEGTITRWLKQVGEAVERDEPLFEVSTDKVDSEVPSPAGGVVSEIRVPEGETVDVGTVLAVVSDGASAQSGGACSRRRPSGYHDRSCPGPGATPPAASSCRPQSCRQAPPLPHLPPPPVARTSAVARQLKFRILLRSRHRLLRPSRLQSLPRPPHRPPRHRRRSGVGSVRDGMGPRPFTGRPPSDQRAPDGSGHAGRKRARRTDHAR